MAKTCCQGSYLGWHINEGSYPTGPVFRYYEYPQIWKPTWYHSSKLFTQMGTGYNRTMILSMHQSTLAGSLNSMESIGGKLHPSWQTSTRCWGSLKQYLHISYKPTNLMNGIEQFWFSLTPEIWHKVYPTFAQSNT